MNLLDYIFMGIMQGLLEWLPVSSKGILSLVMVKSYGLTLANALVISIWLHIGTLLAALVYFRKEVKEILINIPSYIKNPKLETEANKLTSFILIATILTGIIGVPIFLFGLDKFDFTGKIAMLIIAVALIIVGIFQWLAKKLKSSDKQIKVKDSIWLGVAQGFTAIPGISRSGTTTSTLLFCGYSPKEALRLSFLVSIPAVIGIEILLGLIKNASFSLILIPGIIASFILGLISIKFLLKIATKINFGYFCVGFGLLIIIAILLGII